MASINPFLPIQEGTGTPSPENVRPIKPAVSIAGGKNLFDDQSDTITFGKWADSSGSISTAASGCISDYIRVNSLCQMTAMYNGATPYSCSILEYDENKNFIIRNHLSWVWTGYQETPLKIITNSRTKYIRFQVYASSTGVTKMTRELLESEKMQLEEGSTATSYEPYQTLDIYGGYLDIANSRIVEEWDCTDFTDISWIAASTTSVFRGVLTNHKVTNRINAISDSYKSTNRAGIAIADMADKAIKTHDINKLYVYCKDTSYTAVSDFVTATAGKKIAYELETSIIHTLSPTQLAQAMEQLGIKLSSTLIDIRRKIILNSPHLETASGSIANFNTDMKAPLKECKIHFLPVQSGSGDPSPDNIRPITGWDGISITRCGKNLYDPATITMNMEITGNGEPQSTGMSNNWCVSDYIPVKRNTVYTATALLTKGAGRYGIYNDNKEKILVGNEQIGNNAQTIINTGDAGCYVRLTIRIGDGLNTMFEEGSSATTYEPYTGISIPITFPKTIYGGYVDLVKGEVVETIKRDTFENTNMMEYSKWLDSWKGFIFDKINNDNRLLGTAPDSGTPDVLCEIYPTSNVVLINRLSSDKTITMRSSKRVIGIQDTDYLSYGDFYNAVKDYKFTYPLATSNTYTLTPQTIKALKGINNIWSDANGNVEVKYWKH